MKRAAVCFAMVVFIILGAGLVYHPACATAYAQEDWKDEFDAICAKTNDPMVLPKTEIKELIERCDKLLLRIEKLDESTAKVYQKRIRMCRDLFVFVLESGTK